jgi:hypothetical protein
MQFVCQLLAERGLGERSAGAGAPLSYTATNAPWSSSVGRRELDDAGPDDSDVGCPAHHIPLGDVPRHVRVRRRLIVMNPMLEMGRLRVGSVEVVRRLGHLRRVQWRVRVGAPAP